MIYLATKYSDPEALMRFHNYRLALRISKRLIMEKGLFVYSPIIHFHDMAAEFAMPTNAGFWRNINFHMLDLSEALYVHCSFGWRTSIGVAEEIAYAKEIDKPVRYITIDTVSNDLEISDDCN